MQLHLSDVASELNATLIGKDVAFSSVTTDTRHCTKGDLFIALHGPNFDGHDYLDKAHQNGACAAMVDYSVASQLPLLQVADTRLGLGRLATSWRRRFDIPMAAVTGSNGKTTVKEMIAAIMQLQGDVLSTKGNLNNDIGVPLTLLRLQDHHQAAVIEMGANHAGEIAYLCSMAQPNVAVITIAAEAHLEGFGSLDGVAHAKGEMFSNLPSQGIAVINADDKYSPLWQQLAGDRQKVFFGLDQPADVSAQWQTQEQGIHMQINTPAGEVSAELNVMGRHNVMNALAATAVAQQLGADLLTIKAGLESFKSVAGRLQITQAANGMQIIDDTYNANPSSFRAAVDVLSEVKGNKWLVLGDMGELGTDAEQLHAECGRLAKQNGVERLYAVGELSKHAVTAFTAEAEWFSSKQALCEKLINDWQGNGAVLVKGSRSMHMEDVIHALQRGASE